MQEIETARGWIEASRRIVVLTGAGISTDSGIQDFRGPKGLWTKNPAAEKMASIEHYLGDPAVRRAAWQNRLHSPAWQAKPNAGHFAVAQLERLGKLEALITQNVDGLHQAAGNSAEKVIEIHGTIHEVSCLKCGDRAPMERALDTLAIARKRFPGSPASLDALCRRFGIDNSSRTLHGALLDSEILAEVYLELIGGRQPDFALNVTQGRSGEAEADWRPRPRPVPLPARLTEEEAAAHAEFIGKLGDDALWKRFG